VLLIGAGGIGAPAALALAEAGVTRLTVVDDDVVEISNLHRQILFDDADLGRPKLEAFARALGARYPAVEVRCIHGRALPDTALALADEAALIIDACDNFATRFLLADAAHLAGVPVVHAAAVRWHCTVMAVSATASPCYRCLFEDIPTGEALDCATGGVAGPVCGVAGALAADAALQILAGDTSAFGALTSYDGWCDRLRRIVVPARRDCPLCGPGAAISTIAAERYTHPACSP
jgi:molybdopterin/thiamine biosynthesis adenylyltransferase